MAAGVRPSTRALEILAASYCEELKYFESAREQAAALLKIGESQRDESIPQAEHAALGGGQLFQGSVDGGGFARAIWSQEAEYTRAPDTQVQAVHGLHGTKMLGQAARADGMIAGGGFIQHSLSGKIRFQGDAGWQVCRAGQVDFGQVAQT